MAEFSFADKLKKKKNRNKVQKLADNPPAIKENKIVFYASNDFSDNALALYEYMVETGLDRKYEIVWLVRDVEGCRKKDPGNARFIFVKDDRLNMWNWEAQAEAMSARWLFFTHSMNWVKVKRPEQTFVNLWHGCGYKGTKEAEKRITYFDYCLVTGNGYIDIQADHFSCEKDKVLPIGCPRLDWFKTEKSNAADFCRNLMKQTDSDKIILWMPTFRTSRLERLSDDTAKGNIGLPLIDSEDDFEAVNEQCKANRLLIIIKSHNLQKAYEMKNMTNMVFMDDQYLEQNRVNLYEMIAQSDALISDYSSVAIDYMLLDKPMAYVLDDFDEYGAIRGWSFDNVKNYMPGNHIYSIEDLDKYIQEISAGKDSFADERHKIKNIVHNESDNYRERIINYFEI